MLRPHSTTRKTPFEVVLGCVPTFHWAFEDKALGKGKIANLSRDLQERIHRIEIIGLKRVTKVYRNATGSARGAEALL